MAYGPHTSTDMAVEKKNRPKQTGQRGMAVKPAPAHQSGFEAHFINRFKVETDDTFIIIYLASVIEGGLMDSHIVCMARPDLKRTFEFSKSYLQLLGSVSQEPSKPWEYPRSKHPILMANMLNLSHSDDIGELVFSNYIINELAQARNDFSVTGVQAGRVVTARCSLDLLKQILGHLFDGLT